MLIEPPDEDTLTEIVQAADLSALDRGLAWAAAALDTARVESDAETTRVLRNLRCGRGTGNTNVYSIVLMWRECLTFLRGVRVGKQSSTP